MFDRCKRQIYISVSLNSNNFLIVSNKNIYGCESKTSLTLLLLHIVIFAAVNVSYCTRRFVDAALYLECRRTDFLKCDYYWVVRVAERIFEVVVSMGNIKRWTIISCNT